MNDVTRILERWDQGDPGAADELMPLVYDELRRLAAWRMSLQSPGQTLQATALVHEAYVRLVQSGKGEWAHRHHFFAAAAEAMRHILVDRARRRLRARHGAELERVELDDIEVAEAEPEERVLLVHEALDALAAEDPVKAEVVKLHYFVGLTHSEVADVLGLSEKTVRRHWNVAKVRLYEAIRAAQ